MFDSHLYCFHNIIKEHHQRFISARSSLQNGNRLNKKKSFVVHLRERSYL